MYCDTRDKTTAAESPDSEPTQTVRRRHPEPFGVQRMERSFEVSVRYSSKSYGLKRNVPQSAPWQLLRYQ
jgi:hypothetical protein